MVFKLDSTQFSEIEDLLAASNDPLLNQYHPIGQAYGLLAQWAEGQSGVDQASIAWLKGASDINQGIGFYSTLIRSYTSYQHELRFGTALSTSKLQELSDNIGRAVLGEIITSLHGNSSVSDIPSIATIGDKDATPVIEDAFFDDITAWSGVILFPFLGVNTYLNNMLSSTTALSTYQTLSVIGAAQHAALDASISNLAEFFDEVGAAFSNYTGGAYGTSAGIAAEVAGDLAGFISSAYGISNFSSLGSVVVLGQNDESDNTALADAITTEPNTREIIHAGGGDDTITSTGIGGVGDVIDGGDGEDIFDRSADTFDMTVKADADSYTNARITLKATYLPLDYDVLVNIETLKLGEGDDTVEMTLSAASSLKFLDTGDGDDSVDIKVLSGAALETVDVGNGDNEVKITGKAIHLFTGNGDDFIHGGMAEGSRIQTGGGNDHIEISKNVLVTDASSDDNIVFAGAVLTGGVRAKNSDSAYAYGTGSIKYGIDIDNELQIINWFDDILYLANFNNTLSGALTAGISLVEVSYGAYQLLKGPGRFAKSDNIFEVMGLQIKALTGHNPFTGADPIVLDLDGDGLELTARTGVSQLFDLDANQFAMTSGWVRGDDGFLARDLNSNGIIDDGSELVGNRTMEGFDALALLDTNSDGHITSADSTFASFRIWRDLNGNGVTDSGELQTLTEAGITSIDVAATNTTETDNAGNRILGTASFTRSDSSTGTVASVDFSVNRRDTVWTGNDTVSTEAQALPDLKGYGTLPSLHISMTLDTNLLDTVETVLPTLDTNNLETLRANVTPILTAWMASVSITAADAGYEAREDVAVLVDTNIHDGTALIDFAIKITDISGSYYVLGSGEDVLDSNDNPIARPTLEQVMEQVETTGSWTLFSGEQLQFVERYLGTNLLFGSSENITGSGAVEAAQGILSYMWHTLNEVAIRLAVQGPLADYFPGIEYDAVDDVFKATTDSQIQPMLSAIIDDAPTDAGDALEYIQEWTPFIEVFLQDFDRGESYLIVSYAFLAQNLVGAFESTPSSLTFLQLAEALGIPTDLVHTGSSSMTGGDDADIFYMDAGNQTAAGGNGPDVYIFGSDFGHAVINDVEAAPGGGEYDMIRFASLQADDITMERDGVDLIIHVNGSSTQDITVVGQFSNHRPGLFGGFIDDDKGVQEIVFADGTVWDRLDIAKAVSHPASSNDTITGTGRPDWIDGGTGNDSLSGGDDGDVYVFAEGYGQDTIQENMITVNMTAPDVVKLDGLNQDDVTFTRTGNSNDLVISVNGTSDTLTILGQFAATYTGPLGTQWLNRIEGFSFADHSSIGYDEIFDMVIADHQTSGNDTIYGFSREDELDGGAGNDFMSGGNESDIYVFGLGYGDDTIQDGRDNILSGDNDTVRFGEGVLSSEVTLTRTGSSDDLVITLSDDSTLTIINQFHLIYTGPFGNIDFDRIEYFVFADDTEWTWEDVKEQLIASTSGNDTIYGFNNSNDTLEGGLGNDTLNGLGDDDTYLFSEGDGNDIIEEHGFSGNDTLILTGSGLTSTNLIFTRSTDTLSGTLSFTGNSDSIELINQFHLNGAGVESIVFDDDVTMTAADLRELYFAGVSTSGNDTITGFMYGDDTITAGLGNDTINGLNGNDTYIHAEGDGNDTITEDVFSGYADTLVLTGTHLTSTNVHVAYSSSSLNATLTFTGASDTILLTNEFSRFDEGVEYITFSDNITWTVADLREAYLEGAATSGNDTIAGFVYGNDTITGGLGNDTMDGLNGNDTYIHAEGDGNDTITEQVFSGYADTLILTGTHLTSANVHVGYNPGSSLNATLTFTGASDTITLTNEFSHFDEGVENITFSDSVTWTVADLRAAYLASVSTTGNDTITGFTYGNDTITGGLGDDIMSGLDGSDTYVFNIGDGDDIINDIAGNDLISFGSGVTISNLSAAQSLSDSDDVIISYGTTDTITIKDYYLGNIIENVRLSTGTIISLSDLLNASINGTSGNDTLNGTSGSDLINGLAGNDTINGLAGNDTLIGGAGNDAINGGNDTDTVSYAYLTSGGVSISLYDGTANAGSGDEDTLTGIENIVGSDQNDNIIGNDADNIVYGGDGNDEFSLSKGHDTVFSEGTDSRLKSNSYSGTQYVTTVTEGGVQGFLISNHNTTTDIIDTKVFGVQRLELGSGDDVVNLTDLSSSNVLTGIFTGGGNDTIDLSGVTKSVSLAGGQGNDVIVSGEGNDEIHGHEDNDTIVSGGGNDFIEGGTGNDTINGGAGNDDYLFSIGDGNDIIIDSAGTDTIYFGSGITVSNFSAARSLSDSDDLVITYGTSDSIILKDRYLTSSIETIHFANGNTINVSNLLNGSIEGTSGDDTLNGFNNQDDTIWGYDGNDTLNGLSGNDVLFGGDGNDTLTGSAGYDTLNGGNGTDTVSYAYLSSTGVYVNLYDGTANAGSGDEDTLTDIENIVGSGQNDIIQGNDADNIVYGGEGNDEFRLSKGHDTIYSEGVDSQLKSNGYSDTQYVTTTTEGGVQGILISNHNTTTDIIDTKMFGVQRLELGSGDDVVDLHDLSSGNALVGIFTGGGNDTIDLSGVTKNVALAGGHGDDIIISGNGNDEIHGHEGDDVITGGGGVDTIEGGSGSDTFVYTSVSDSGIGSGNRDIITDFSQSDSDLLDFSAFSGTFTFLGTGAFTGGSSPEIRYQDDGTNTIVSVDTNHDTVTDFHIQLNGHITLTSGDFLL